MLFCEFKYLFDMIDFYLNEAFEKYILYCIIYIRFKKI